LHYAQVDGVVYFASELAALLCVAGTRRPLDRAALAQYLVSGYCAAPNDPVAGYRKLQPGEMVVIDTSGDRHLPFWRVSLGRVAKVAPVAARFDPIFQNAVRRQTDVDVEYGVLLSGGVDSALVAAVARNVRPQRPLTAYCARFSESTFDESEHAAEVAERLGCRFVTVDITAEQFAGMLQHLTRSTGELLADPAWIPHAMVARRASRDVPMVLGGEGADELFGGYPTYLGASFAARYQQLPRVVRGALGSLIARLPVSDKNMTVSFMLKRFIQGEGLDGLARHVSWKVHVAPSLLRRLGIDPPALARTPETAADELMDQVQRHDFTQSLPEALLAKADRGGMCYGVETRAPFLDPAVIEFAATLPVRERVRGLNTKVFLKHYARRYLPASVVDRRKRGLSVPLTAWLRGGVLFDWAHERLTASSLKDVGIDTSATLALLFEHRAGQHDHAKAIWALAVLSEWLAWYAQLR
jgi:asparagine synthase (glutamine-hydrolysing)